MVRTVEMACMNHTGYIRENNEDNFYFNDTILSMEHKNMARPLKIFFSTEQINTVAVFDGMGGENAGEVASYAAAECFRDICHIQRISKPKLQDMIEELNAKVCQRAEQDRLGQIGTTATILFFYQNYVYVVNVGDSPAYIMRNGKLELISEKHTNEELLKLSKVKRNPVLTQFLGIPEDEMFLEPYIAGMEMRRGDILLICSDGLTDMVLDTDIREILECNETVFQMVENLMREALLNGGRDNITIICCSVLE